MRLLKLAVLSPGLANRSHFLQRLAIEDMDDLLSEIVNIHELLLWVARKRDGCRAAPGLGIFAQIDFLQILAVDGEHLNTALLQDCHIEQAVVGYANLVNHSELLDIRAQFAGIIRLVSVRAPVALICSGSGIED